MHESVRAFLPVALVALVAVACSAQGQTLAERLGFQPNDKVLIINGDDVGMCHTANLATIVGLERGLLTGATIMVPCPWFPEIATYARKHPEKDFGIHLVQTSEWIPYRWGPVAPRDQVPGLLDPEGYFWSETPQVYAKATPSEALIESRAQIRKALAAGVNITHLDSHMGVLQYLPAYLEVYLQLAVEFDLPVRMASQATFEAGDQPQWRAKFAGKGILFTDDFVHDIKYNGPQDVKTAWLKRLGELKPGVTEIYIHAGQPTEELKAITGSWETRSAELATFTDAPEIRALIAREGIKFTSYRFIRELQRRNPKPIHGQ